MMFLSRMNDFQFLTCLIVLLWGVTILLKAFIEYEEHKKKEARIKRIMKQYEEYMEKNERY